MRYVVRERVFAIGEDFWVENEAGERVFLVDGSAFRLRETFELKDTGGAVAAVARKKLVALRETFEIMQDGEVVATVKPALFSPLRDRFVVDAREAGRMEIRGDLLGREFDIEARGQVIGRVSRKWFHLRDTYGVEVAPGVDDAFVIALAVCVDRVVHEHKQHQE